MPPLSTNVIEDDNISSTISKLDLDQFTYSSGDGDALSDSILTTLKLPYKRR